jgi:predicted MFS family arabinose efflux permease
LAVPGGGVAGEEPAVDRIARGDGQSMIRDLAEGWREFTSHTWIWVMTAGSALFLFAIDGPIQVLGPVVARDVYDGARTWGFTSAAMGLGQIAGGLLALRWRPRRPMLVIAAGMSVTALPVALLALEAPVWTLYTAMVAVGVEWGLYEPFWLTCMQREVAPSMISRVASYDYFGLLAFYPAGLALAGPLADAFGHSTLLWVSAGVAIVVSIFQLSWRDVRAPKDMGPRGLAEPAPAAPANG